MADVHPLPLLQVFPVTVLKLTGSCVTDRLVARLVDLLDRMSDLARLHTLALEHGELTLHGVAQVRMLVPRNSFSAGPQLRCQLLWPTCRSGPEQEPASEVVSQQSQTPVCRQHFRQPCRQHCSLLFCLTQWH